MPRPVTLILSACAALAAVFFAVGFALPRQVVLTASIRVEPRPDEVRRVLSDLRTWPQWSLFGGQTVPGTSMRLPDAAGTGSQILWVRAGGEEVARLALTQAGAEGPVVAKFQKASEGSEETFVLRSQGRGTEIRWKVEVAGEPGVVARWGHLWQGHFSPAAEDGPMPKALERLREFLAVPSGVSGPGAASPEPSRGGGK